MFGTISPSRSRKKETQTQTRARSHSHRIRDSMAQGSASQPVCRGTKVSRESGGSVPRKNVGNQ